MNQFLERILAVKKAEAAALPESPTPTSLAPVREFSAALRNSGISIIAEIKRRSPSKGALRDDLDAGRLAAEYERAGAAAISCLTDTPFFGALPHDLPNARGATQLPILRKDFVIDGRQVHQSRQMGADAILLIARILSSDRLRELLTLARRLEMAALVEVHDEVELDRALECGAAIIGVNNRDLDTFEVNIETAFRLMPRIPSDRIAVAESGISRRADLERLEQIGYDAVLLGEALVTADRPFDRLKELRGERS